MKQIYRDNAWLIVAFVVGFAVILTVLNLIDFGRLRYFNATFLTVTWAAWMNDYIESRPMLYRRQRRLRLAFALFLFSGMYGSLNAAVSESGNPTSRVVLVSITTGVLLCSILFHPENDLKIPQDRQYRWEIWLRKQLHRHI